MAQRRCATKAKLVRSSHGIWNVAHEEVCMEMWRAKTKDGPKPKTQDTRIEAQWFSASAFSDFILIFAVGGM